MKEKQQIFCRTVSKIVEKAMDRVTANLQDGIAGETL